MFEVTVKVNGALDYIHRLMVSNNILGIIVSSYRPDYNRGMVADEYTIFYQPRVMENIFNGSLHLTDND